MSYDGWLMMDTGGPEMAQVAELGNHTSNTSGMWRKALAAAGEDIRLADTEGRVAGEALPLLRKALAHMVDHPDEYTPLNPPNGWGNYESATEYLRGVVNACEAHPLARLAWWV